jgi:hypothetical protein
MYVRLVGALWINYLLREKINYLLREKSNATCG